MKTRMNAYLRNALVNLARKIVAVPTEAKATLAAYKKAAPLVLRDIHARYPVKDMNILLKYEAADRDDCIRAQMTSGGVAQFRFNEKCGPLVPHRGCQVHAVKADTSDAIQDWATAADAEKEALRKKLSDYRSLIDFSRTLEDVEAVWPEAAQARGNIITNLPALLSQDVVARIAADVAQRAKVA